MSNLSSSYIDSDSVAIILGQAGESKELFLRFGRNGDIDTSSTPEDIWHGGGIYTGFPTGAAETMEARSSSSNDTSGGSGAREITIKELQIDGVVQPDVVVVMNGTSWVQIDTTEYDRGSLMEVTDAGSSERNEGNITLRHTSTTTNIFCVMPATFAKTAIGCFTIPKGKKFLLKANTKMSRANGSPGSATVSIRCREYGSTVWVTLRPPEITQASGDETPNEYYFIVPERADVKVTCDDVSDNNTVVQTDIFGYMVNV